MTGDNTTRMPFALASSAIDIRLPSISSSVSGPMFPAIHVGLAGKEFSVLAAPCIRNRIAHEDDALDAFGRQGQVRVLHAIARKVRPVFENCLTPFQLRLQRGNFILWRSLRKSAQAV